MQNAERIAEVLTVVCQRDIVGVGEVETGRWNGPARDSQRLLGWINAMENADARRDQRRPSTGTTTEIESLRVRREQFKWKNGKIAIEEPLPFFIGKLRLIERAPFLAESSDSRRVDVG
jgi:hypothetical protein